MILCLFPWSEGAGGSVGCDLGRREDKEGVTGDTGFSKGPLKKWQNWSPICNRLT